MDTQKADKNIYGNPGPSSPMELNSLLPSNIPKQRHHSNKTAYLSLPQYTYKEFNFVEELGEGAFGNYFNANYSRNGTIFWKLLILLDDVKHF